VKTKYCCIGEEKKKIYIMFWGEGAWFPDQNPNLTGYGKHSGWLFGIMYKVNLLPPKNV
jgi:hypothetical protein